MSNHGNIKKGLFLLLHISLLCSSLSGVCSKMASRYTDNIFSLQFIFWFVIMFGYAIIWQQILKRMPLTVAYANKPVTLIWGIIWGKLIFDEKITWSMILGACIIFAGIYLVTSGDKEENGGERI